MSEYIDITRQVQSDETPDKYWIVVFNFSYVYYTQELNADK